MEEVNNIDYEILEVIDEIEGKNYLYILYITFIVIIGILLLWIIISTFTKTDDIKILSEIINMATHIKPVSDI